jgi:ATP-dependent helicase/nuclease subunit A
MGAAPCWYSKAEEAIAALDPKTEGDARVIASPDWNLMAAQGTGSTSPAPRMALPPWATSPAAPLPRPPQPLSPSALPGAKALSGEGGDDSEHAMKRGTMVHRLLEELPNHPKEAWQTVAPLYAPEHLPADFAEAKRVLEAPALQFVFSADTLAEVPITGEISATGEKIFGLIDRLIVSETDIHAIDFKTNRVIPETPDAIPEGLLRQLDAYGDALGQIYPARAVSLSLLWTFSAQIVTLAHEDVKRLLQNISVS